MGGGSTSRGRRQGCRGNRSVSGRMRRCAGHGATSSCCRKGGEGREGGSRRRDPPRWLQQLLLQLLWVKRPWGPWGQRESLRGGRKRLLRQKRRKGHTLRIHCP